MINSIKEDNKSLPGGDPHVLAVGARVLVGVRAVRGRHQPARAHQRGPAERLEVIARPGEELVRDLEANHERVFSGLTS